MKNQILLVLAVVLVACSTPSGPAPVALDATAPSVSTSTAVAPPHTVLDEPEQPIAPPPKVDTRTPTQKLADAKRDAMAACRGSDGSWHCNDPSNKNGQIKAPLMAGGNATAAQCGPACTVGNWYIDPQNTTTCASDGNSCTSATCAGSGIGPCLTFAQIVTRLGSSQPQYPHGQNVVFTLLSSQTANTDDIFFEPRISGGSVVELTGLSAATAAGANFTAGALTGGYGYAGAVPSAGGVEMTMAAVPGYVTGGTLLLNTSRSPTEYAFVDAVTGGNATLTQPQTSTSLTTFSGTPAASNQNDWVGAADVISALVLPTANLKRWAPVGMDVNAGNTQFNLGVLLGIQIADTSGIGVSVMSLPNRTAETVASLVRFNERVNYSSEGGRGTHLLLMGCWAHAANASMFMAPMEAELQGGAYNALTVFSGQLIGTQNVVLHGTSTIEACILQSTGSGTTNGIFSDGTVIPEPGASLQIGSFFWGSYGANLQPNSAWVNSVGGAGSWTAKVLLTNGTLLMGGATTGWSFDGTTTFTSGVTLTPAHIDSAPNQNLQDVYSGARFTLAN